MHPLKTIWMLLVVASFALIGSAAYAEGDAATTRGQGFDYESYTDNDIANKETHNEAQGGKTQIENRKAKTNRNLGKDLNAKGVSTLNPMTPTSGITTELENGQEQAAVKKYPYNQVQTNEPPTIGTDTMAAEAQVNTLVGAISDPQRWTKPAQAAAQAKAKNAGNAGAECSSDHS